VFQIKTFIDVIKLPLSSLKKHLSSTQRLRLRVLWQDFISIPWGRDLSRLGSIYGTDKSEGHGYTGHYQRHFSPLKYSKLNLLEIGVGGYERAHSGGGSLRMWRRYFTRGQIYAIDIHDKHVHQERRITFFRGDQSDREFLRRVADVAGGFDIIIDDGSHRVTDVILSFETLFPQLNSGGIYVVEDTQTSYWPVCGGNSEDLDAPGTTMAYFKQRVDGLNYREFMLPGYTSNYFDRNITAIHFYHNLIFIHKGDNTEESNVLVDNCLPSGDQSNA